MNKLLYPLLLLLAVSGCKQGEKSNDTRSMVSKLSEIEPPPPAEKRNKMIPYQVAPDREPVPQAAIPSADKQKIIKDGTMSIKANDITGSKQSLDQAVKSESGYYETEEYQNTDYRSSYELKIRIPAVRFEAFITALESGKDEIVSKTIEARDVTEEYFDTETRLINKRKYLERYREILTKASTVKDILNIEESMRTIEEEIESSEGRLKYLDDQVAYSTLSIHLLHEKDYVYRAPQQDKFSERLRKSLSNGWTALVNFILDMVMIWPVLLVAIAAFFLIRTYIKRRRNKRLKKSDESR